MFFKLRNFFIKKSCNFIELRMRPLNNKCYIAINTLFRQ